MSEERVAGKILVDLLTPAKRAVQTSVYMVVIPSRTGRFAVLPRRAPFISRLGHGLLAMYREKDSTPTTEERFFISGGTAHFKDDACKVMADDALRMDMVDVTKIAVELAANRRDFKALKSPQAIEEMREHIEYLEFIMVTMEKENPRPVVKPRSMFRSGS